MNRETYEPDNLIAGNEVDCYPVARTIKQSETPYVRGTVLGKDADDKFLISVKTAEDGSQEPRCILSQDVDATEGDVVAVVYESGVFRGSCLTLGEGHTAESIQFDTFMQNIKIGA